MIADLFPLLISGSGRSGTIGARATRRMAGAVVTQYSRKHKPKMQLLGPVPCPCQSWKKADYIYQGFDTDAKATWRAGVKKAGLSAYDLWMKACVYNFARGLNAPDAPPVSGGFSQLGNIPGDRWHPPPLDAKPWDPEKDPDFNPPPPPPEPGEPCEECEHTYLVLCVTVAGMTGVWAALNGQHVVTQHEEMTCSWAGGYVEMLTKETPTQWALSIALPDPFLIARGPALSEEYDCGEAEGQFTDCEEPVEDKCEDFPGWDGQYWISTTI